jgi:hypothetical protein
MTAAVEKEPTAHLGRSSGKPDRVAAAVASLVVLLVAIVPALAAHPHGVFDTFGYMDPPSLSSGRLPVVPALYWLARHDLRTIEAIQTIIGAICWLLLIWELSYVRIAAIRAVVMSSVVLLACSTYVVAWYAAMLSESLSISLLVLLVFFLARWQRTGSSLWPAVAVASAGALTRSTSAYVLLLAAIVLVPYTLIRHRGQTPKVAVLVVIAVAGTWLSAQGQLWQQPFLHSLSERILPNSGYTAWFVAHGMPTSPTLSHLAGPYTATTDAAYKSPAMGRFRSWMDGSGKSTYALFIASHPRWALTGTFGRHEELRPNLIYYYGRVTRPWYPAALRDVLLFRRQTILAAIGVLDLLVVASALLRRAWNKQTNVWLAMIVLGIMTLVIDWAGDSWEVGRHSVEGTLM